LSTRENFIEELLGKTDLVELVGQYVSLTKKSGSFWACCPFHHEKTPSFQVNPFKQLYYCFGSCQTGGNAITFIKNIESVDSSDAIKILAKRIGLEIPNNFGFLKSDSVEIAKKKEVLLKLTKDTAKHYHQNLCNSKNKTALEYLLNRGIEKSIIQKFGLGYSDNSNLIKHLESLGYTLEQMKEANVAMVSEKGVYDPFFNRVIVPIINQFGEVVAFGGRTLEKNPDFAKYRNSSNTLIFEKNKVLFAANLLQLLKKTGTKLTSVILCEGYMDVIALHAAGFTNAVASMGTAFSFNQAKQIKNFVEKVFISFDGDTAGQKNTLSAIDVLQSVGLSIRVVMLPQGKDPDDIVKTGGSKAYQKLLDNAITATAFKLNSLLKNYNLEDSQEKAKFTAEAVKVIKTLENPVEQDEYYKKLQKLSGYSLEVLYKQAEFTIEVPLPTRGNNENSEKELQVDSVWGKENKKILESKKFILASLVAKKDFVDYKEDFESFIKDQFSIAVIGHFVLNYKKSEDSVASLYAKLDENCHKALNEILYEYKFTEGDLETYYKDCIRNLKTYEFTKEKELLFKEFFNSKDDSKKQKLKQKLNDVEEKLKELKTSKT